jgi:Na+-translocating ferredoxin:NAD+ oxidoreductase RnfG subunit
MKLLVTLLILLTVNTAFTIPEKIEKKADKVIVKFYEIESFSKKVVAISEVMNAKTVANFKEGNLFQIISEDKNLGYGYIGTAPSKTATFEYLILFDQDFIITKSKVLIYREEYGGEISSKRWLRQFDGAKAGAAALKYNEDIIPISGATISVRSMTRAINGVLESIAILKKEKAL